MFDWIRCEAPLPETPAMPPDAPFQTKDTPDQYVSFSHQSVGWKELAQERRKFRS
ncbi:hypothetical protein LAZ40_02195 [Cereibacter sphaeroides]|uniref:hypothetical protein n=1 Tax=Cereibacter sphaeroides TaxID=1063 RepID=UPI001F38228D|nr:hypothetical protein [Cereibacter sphaeroides]MCE6957868.1 hypothetical protein [Cereibacter sphaeroides]MCE6971837.1 hypothetical protein [Cereibacter sphaeroides]